MNELTKLEKLIKELCPNGVIYKKTYEIADVSIGEFVHKNKQNPNGKYPVFNGGTSNTGFYDDYNRTANKIIISARGANAGFVNRVFTNYWSGNSCYTVDVVDEALDWNFVYYWFKNSEKILLGEQQKGGIPAVSKKQVENFRVPVPPLEVQSEIVRILDNFTELTAELTAEHTAELTARKKQYEYYRDELLSLPDAPRMPLSKLTLKVSSINWKNINGTKKYIDLSSVDRETHSIIDADVLEVSADNAPSRAKQLVQENDILFGGTRPMLKRYCIVPTEYDEQVCSTGYCVLRLDNKIALTNYVYHCLGTSEFYRYVEANQQGASYPAIGDKVLKDYEIPVPTLEMQEKIAMVLDRFNSLCNDISNGLPAEIEARQKQYEYYREKLLTFKELSV